MARYRGPRCRLSRREGGVDLQLTNKKRSLESKCRADMPPGQHGDKSARDTNYRSQLRMKQLLKRYYGILERQFRGLYKKAERLKGSTGDNLLLLLESRLDNLVYRLGFACTRAEARQIVTHKGVMVNGKMVNIPSCIIKVSDVISMRSKCGEQDRVKYALQLMPQNEVPEWLERDGLQGTFKRYPDASELPPEFKVHLVVEFYSK